MPATEQCGRFRECSLYRFCRTSKHTCLDCSHVPTQHGSTPNPGNVRMCEGRTKGTSKGAPIETSRAVKLRVSGIGKLREARACGGICCLFTAKTSGEANSNPGFFGAVFAACSPRRQAVKRIQTQDFLGTVGISAAPEITRCARGTLIGSNSEFGTSLLAASTSRR